MEIRPAVPNDCEQMVGLDATIESEGFVQLWRVGEGALAGWQLEEVLLEEKQILSNPLDDETAFMLRQIVSGADEGAALVAEHEGAVVGLAIAQPRAARNTLQLLDLRVDYDYRRQGLGSALLFEVIAEARRREARAVAARTLTGNLPAGRLLAKCGFQLTGLDTHRNSNHDLADRSVCLMWHLSVD